MGPESYKSDVVGIINSFRSDFNQTVHQRREEEFFKHFICKNCNLLASNTKSTMQIFLRTSMLIIVKQIQASSEELLMPEVEDFARIARILTAFQAISGKSRLAFVRYPYQRLILDPFLCYVFS